VTSPGYRIKRVDGTNEDIAETLTDLHDSTFGNSAPQVEPEEGYWWIAYHGNEPVAFAGMKKANSTEAAAYMSRSGVLREHRGHGLQVRLLRVREALARRLGWTKAFSDTTCNIPSSNNLIRAGYRLFDADPWAFEHSLYWIKDL
jgi:GNAT superfamily N-acetyltransferase